MLNIAWNVSEEHLSSWGVGDRFSVRKADSGKPVGGHRYNLSGRGWPLEPGLPAQMLRNGQLLSLL